MASKQYFTLVRRGQVLGRFSRSQIKDGLSDKTLRITDKFKDPRDATWKELRHLTKDVTCKPRQKKPARRYFGRNKILEGLEKIGPDIFESKQTRPTKGRMEEPYVVCGDCRRKYSAEQREGFFLGMCPHCGCRYFREIGTRWA